MKLEIRISIYMDASFELILPIGFCFDEKLTFILNLSESPRGTKKTKRSHLMYKLEMLCSLYITVH